MNRGARGTGSLAMGHIAIAPKRTCESSWWIGQPTVGFTVIAAKEMNVAVPVDDVSDAEVQRVVARQYVHDVLIGLQLSKASFGVRAVVENRN